MRAFVAIDLPDAIHAALREKQETFRAVCREARWTRPEGIHLTLKFLGEISEAQVKQVSDALGALERFEAFEIAVKGFGFFPDARRPRVFWAGLEAPPLLPELAARVEAALQPLGFPREHRPFTPHLTLARFNIPRPQPALQKLIEQDLGAVRDLSPSAEGEPSLLGRFEVSEFFLFESKLSPRGAEYTKVARFPR
jgi:2'-5' RNA ligase